MTTDENLSERAVLPGIGTALNETGPQFAIVRVPDSSAKNALRLHELLLRHGYAEVSFVNELRSDAFLPHIQPSGSAIGSLRKPSSASSQQNGHDQVNSTLSSRPLLQAGEDKQVSMPTTGRGESSADAELAVPGGGREGIESEIGECYSPNVGINDTAEDEEIGDEEPSGFEDEYHEGLGGGDPSKPLGNLYKSGNPSVDISGLQARSIRPRLIPLPSNILKDDHGVGNYAEDDETVVRASGRTEVYSKCHLCPNSIMSTRLSNLINHVKRHADLKQYLCPHCRYGHNEQAKVKLHMSHNHSDNQGKVKDALCPAMQKQWAQLMEKCFPKHAKRFGPSAAMAAANSTNSGNSLAKAAKTGSALGGSSQAQTSEAFKFPLSALMGGSARQPTTSTYSLGSALPILAAELQDANNKMHTCVACGEMVAGEKLLDHLAETHRNDCRPYVCGECGYQGITESKVRQHIDAKHGGDKTLEVSRQSSAGAKYALFVERFFPPIETMHEDGYDVDMLMDVNPDGDEEEGEGEEVGDEDDELIEDEELQNLIASASAEDEMNDEDGEGECGGNTLTDVNGSPQPSTSQVDKPVEAEKEEVKESSKDSDPAPIQNETPKTVPPLILKLNCRVDSSSSNPIVVQPVEAICEMCGRTVQPEPISNILHHSKRHYITKQYQCPVCITYTCIERASTEAHIREKHPQENGQHMEEHSGAPLPPIDKLSNELKSAWVETAKKCFPNFHSQVEQWWLREWRRAKQQQQEQEDLNLFKNGFHPPAGSIRESEFQLPEHYWPNAAPGAADASSSSGVVNNHHERASSAASTTSSTASSSIFNAENKSKRRKLSSMSTASTSTYTPGEESRQSSLGPSSTNHSSSLTMVTRSSSRKVQQYASSETSQQDDR